MRSTSMRRAGVALISAVAFCTTSAVQAGYASAAPAPARKAAQVHSDPVVVSNATAKCSALTGARVAAGEIDLPTSGSVIASAAPVPATATAPAYCRVTGSIVAANPSDPPINFQVNLPTRWTRGALQFGGGGFNGRVVSGLGNVPHAPAGAPTPLQRGYLTFGDDSGNQGPGGAFGLNAQSLANYAGESVKRAHDNAFALAQRFYGQTPERMYFAGASKGGHEALIAAQRYGSEYDGVIAYYPANQNQAMVLSWFRMWEAAYRVPGGHVDANHRALLQQAVLAACDRLDGAVDRIVSNLDACRVAFNVQTLACPGDAEQPGQLCLTRTQIDTLNTAATVMEFAFPLANGVTSIGPYPIFEGADTSPWLTDPATAGAATAYGGFTDQVIRFFIQQDPASTTVGFDYRDWQERVQYISELADATDPDLDDFRANGGKMLLVQGTTDMLVTHTTTSAYFERVQARYGARTAQFARYYVVPGFAHGGGEFPMTWDSLTALEAWVEDGRAPKRPVAVAGQRSRPLCEYPTFPLYQGRGDPDDASNYRCAKRAPGSVTRAAAARH